MTKNIESQGAEILAKYIGILLSTCVVIMNFVPFDKVAYLVQPVTEFDNYEKQSLKLQIKIKVNH